MVMPNTAVDIIVIVIILLSAILAFVRGFVREFLSLTTWTLAAILGFKEYAVVAPYFKEYIHQDQLRDFAGGVAVFLGVLLILIPLSMYIRSFIKGEQITSIDRSFGFLFGAARGYALISIIYLIVSWLLPEEKQPIWLKEANTKPALNYGAELVKEIIPQEQLDLMQKKAKSTEDSKDETPEKSIIPSGGPIKQDGGKDDGEKQPDMLKQILEDVKGAPKK
ncbi:MAG: CvpA family protein [Alphaproteobacteria bacterium]|nr:CvpA family protein [Alphaproteobacteria bacterium]